LAVSNTGGGNVSVLLGNGSGGFVAAGSPVPVGASPIGIAVGRFNLDEHVDLAVANADDHTVSILYGNGTGQFAAGPILPVGTSAFEIVAADFDDDGDYDLAVTNFLSNSVSMWLGGIGPIGTFPTGTSPVGITASDINGDGTLDVVIANYGSDSFTVFLGKGTGVSYNFPIGAGPVNLTAGDFNGDGKMLLHGRHASRRRHRRQPTLAYQLRDRLHPIVRAGHAGLADRDAAGRLRVHRVERQHVFRHRALRGDDARGCGGHCHIPAGRQSSDDSRWNDERGV
jgi:hypothetical protein